MSDLLVKSHPKKHKKKKKKKKKKKRTEKSKKRSRSHDDISSMHEPTPVSKVRRKKFRDSQKPHLNTLARGEGCGAIRDFSSPPPLAKGENLIMSFGDAFVRRPMCRDEDSMAFGDYDAETMFSNTPGIYRKGWKQGVDRSDSRCIIDIFGREYKTGRSVTLSVEFRPSISIEFDEVVTNPNPLKAIKQLRKQMISVAIEKSMGKPENKRLHGEARHTKLGNLNRYWKERVDKIRIDSHLSYLKRGFGFVPDLEEYEKTGIHRHKKFPMLTLFFTSTTDADLLAETLFLREKTTLLGWRRCNEKLTPLLDLIVRGDLEPGGTFEVSASRLKRPPGRIYYHTDREFTIKFDPTRDLDAKKLFQRREDLAMEIPHVTILSFDIECISPTFNFPNPQIPDNIVINIGCSMYSTATQKFRSVMLALKGVSTKRIMDKTRADGGESDMDPFELRSFEGEPQLFEGFRDLVIEVDPDIMFAWNITFDLGYIRDRILTHYRYMKESSRFFCMSRMIAKRCSFTEQTTVTSAHGKKTMISMRLPGRIVMDLMRYLSESQDFRFPQYSLEVVGDEVLGKGAGKTHFSPTDMMAAWMSGDPVQRRRVALYCIQDTIVPVRIWNELLLHSRTVMEARVTSTIQERIINGGQQVRNFSLLYRLSTEYDFMLNRNPEDPAYEPTFRLKDIASQRKEQIVAAIQQKLDQTQEELGMVRARLKNKRSANYSRRKEVKDNDRRKKLILLEKQLRESMAEDKYEGAIVLDVKRGIYQMVVTLDFKSLYPSIIIRYNLDTSTMVTDPRYLNLPGWDYITTELGDDGAETVVVQNVKGLVPIACQKMLDARGVAKRLMKAAAKGSREYKNRDGQQKAFKVTGNSLYGGWGVEWQKGKYTSRPLARTVTARGRNLIERTVDNALDMFGKAPDNAEIVMGDTDSVFVSFDPKEYPNTLDGRTRAWNKAVALGERCNEDFNTPENPMVIELEVEKVYSPYLAVFMKKRYTGEKRDKPHYEESTLDCKGDMEVRRDASDAEKHVFAGCKKILFGTGDVNHACTTLIEGLHRMLDRKVPLRDYVRTCKMRDTYNQRTAQGCARERAEARRPGSGVRSGSRMSFVFVWPRNADPDNPPANYDMSEVLEYVEEKKNCQTIDIFSYIAHMENKVVDLFDLVGSGERSRQIFKQALAIAQRQRSGQLGIFGSAAKIKDVPDAKEEATMMGVNEKGISDDKRRRLKRNAKMKKLDRVAKREKSKVKESEFMRNWFNGGKSGGGGGGGAAVADDVDIDDL